MLFHDRYILHNSFADYVEIATAPQQEQLGSFQRYYHEFCDLNITTDSEIGLIAKNEKDESILGLYVKYKSMGRIEIVRQSGGNFSTIYFCLGAESIESKHCSLLLSDEFKFMNSRKVIYGSMLPTLGNRNGVFVALSSASHDYCVFQDMIEKNIIADMEDVENGLFPEIEYTTWDNSTYDKSRPDNVMEFTGRRIFVQHWSSMVLQNNGYALAVSRAIVNGRDDPDFAVMYDNKFLSKKTSTFFDIKELHNNYTKMFEYDNIQKYLNDPKYTIIAGLDPAVTGDNSLMFIKALESGFGEDRTSKIIAIYMLNPMKDKNLESILSQAKSVAQLIEQYDIKSLVVDESGVGKSMTNYIKDELRRMRYYRIDYKNIVEYVITSGNRNTLLEYYYNRIQSGLEKFFGYSKEMLEEENLKKLYVNALKSNSEKALEIITLYEHVKFVRTVYKDEKTNQVKVEYRQAELNFLHDDSIFSSALCSYILSINPTLTNLGSKPSISKNTAMGSSRFNKRW